MCSKLINIISQTEDQAKETLETFINECGNIFTFKELNKENQREAIWEALFTFLSDQNAFKIHPLCLTTVRFLGRDKTDLKKLITEDKVCVLLERANLKNKDEVVDNEVVIEALKCLCNIIFNYHPTASLCVEHGCLEEIMQRVDTKRLDIMFFDMKILFLITAVCKSSRSQVPLNSRNDLIQLLDLTVYQECEEKVKVDVLCEVLKVVFNLTMELETEEADCDKMLDLLSKLLLAEVVNKLELTSQIVNLLTNLPTYQFALLIKGSPESPSMVVMDKLVEFLKYQLNNTEVPKLECSLVPILTVLIKASKGNRLIRKYLRREILPPLKDVSQRPEEGDTLRNQLCRFLTTPNTTMRDLTADLLFVLCKENVGRMVKYTGYGNAAGLLAQRGLLGGGDGKRNYLYSSDSEDSDTEEYKEHRHGINPVTGCFETPRPNPMANMSEEQKEYEAMKLVGLIEELTRKGLIQPCKIGEDGKPTPIEHVLQLQDSLNSNEASLNKEDD